MGAPTTFTTPGGEEMVVLPRCDYDGLLDAAEGAQDVAAYDAARALREGGAELVPASVVDALLAGENPVRVWRRHRGLTLAGLAAGAGLSESYLSQIETGVRQGSVEKLKAVSQALDLTLDDLI